MATVTAACSTTRSFAATWAVARLFTRRRQNVLHASSGGALKLSRDWGRTFAPIGNLRESLAGEIAINPSDPKIMLAGSRERRCWRSQDAGETWTRCQGPTGQVLAFHFDGTGHAWRGAAGIIHLAPDHSAGVFHGFSSLSECPVYSSLTR